ncbi:hypothetical protein Tco_0456110 [Tanacetum coccineum]
MGEGRCYQDPCRQNKFEFVPKGEKDEFFGMHIPKELITEAIQQSPYYQQYQEMVARKPTAKEGGKRKTISKAEQPKKSTPIKQTKLAPAKQPKPVKEKTSNPSPTKKIRKGKVVKVCKVKSPLKLIDEDEEALHEPEPQGEGEDYYLD